MDAIDTQTTKVTQMREYIKKCRAELSATEVAELANRLRQYWSASSNKQNYLEKISELEKETQKVLKARTKANNIFFVVGILVALAFGLACLGLFRPQLWFNNAFNNAFKNKKNSFAIR